MGKPAAKLILGGAIATLLLLAGYDAAFGQGEINFYTRNPDLNYGVVFQYNGTTRVAGSAFDSQLFGCTTSNGTFIPISPVWQFSTGSDAGYVNYGIITVAGSGSGTTYYYELLVWTESAGSYANAMTINGDQYGTSAIESLILGDEGSDVRPNGFPNLTLTLTSVPEPTTCALMGLGGLSLWLFRRRK